MLRRTADVLRDLAQICRRLELPLESLPVAMEIYASMERAAIAERQRADYLAFLKEQRVDLDTHTSRMPMTITSLDQEWKPLRIRPGATSEVIARPQHVYRVCEIEIDGDPSRWLVHDIRVGNRSQSIGGTRPILGERFRRGGIMSDVKLDTCQTAMDFAMVVEYVGPLPEGEVFMATLVGTAVVW